MKRQLFSLAICTFLVLGLFSFSFSLIYAPSGDGVVKVDVPPRGTFLHAIDGFPYHGAGDKVLDETLGLNVIIGSYYNVEDPAIVDLHAEGFTEGDKIIITYTAKLYYDGTYHPTNPDAAGWSAKNETELFWGGLLGVFSTTQNLKDIKEANRVPDAVDSGISEILTPTTKWYEPLQEISDKLRAHGEVWYTGPEYTDISYDFKITNPHQGFEMTIPRNARFLFLCCIDDLYYDNLGEIKLTIEKDTDEDGIPDNWEKNGLDINKDGIIDLDLPMLGADWEHKDIFVEVDGMTDWPPSFWATKEAFANSPVTNPDGVNGVNLHIISDEKVPVSDPFRVWTDYDNYKNQFFGSDDDTDETVEAKKLVFRYCIIVTGTLSLWNGTHYEPKPYTGGMGETPGDDFVVKINPDTSNDDLNGVFMHELGHTLGLEHGGFDEVNYKPNYLSVMNYLFDTTSLAPNRPLDYSRKELPSLNEQNLDEDVGIGVNHTATVWIGPPPENKLYISNIGYFPIDWNGDGNFTSGVKVNLNNHPDWNYNSSDNEVLIGYNDWQNLIYRFRGYPDSFIPSVHEAVAIERDYWKIIQKEKESADLIELSTEYFLKDESPEQNIKTTLSSRGTFLRAEPFQGSPSGGLPVEEPFIIDLIAEGFEEGDLVTISYSGEFHYRAFWDDGTLGETYSGEDILLLGLFSSSEDLNSIENLNRVPGAIDYGDDVTTEPTYFRQLQTDISEDFRIQPSSGATFMIPEGAKYLFISIYDGYYPDNVGSITISITGSGFSSFPVELIVIFVVALLVIILILLLLSKRKKKKEEKP